MMTEEWNMWTLRLKFGYEASGEKEGQGLEYMNFSLGL